MQVNDFKKMPRRTFLFLSFLTLLVACSFGCAPSSSAPISSSPELTEETIRERINDAYVGQVPEENGAGEPISWRFDENEPKEFTIIEKELDGDRATIVLDIKTQTAAGARSPKYLAGQIRTKWELRTGWVLRRWEILETENISLKFINLPKTGG